MLTLPQFRLKKQEPGVGLTISHSDYAESASAYSKAITTNRVHRMRKPPEPLVPVPERLPRPTCFVAYDKDGDYLGRLESKDIEEARLEVPNGSIIVEELEMSWIKDEMNIRLEEYETNKKAYRRITFNHALAPNVLCVASSRIEGTWSAYCDAVPGHSHDNEEIPVLEQGVKMSENIARVLFPQFKDIPYSA